MVHLTHPTISVPRRPETLHFRNWHIAQLMLGDTCGEEICRSRETWAHGLPLRAAMQVDRADDIALLVKAAARTAIRCE
jgi:hypothetical protein